MIKPLRTGPRVAVDKINELIDAVNRMGGGRGDNYVGRAESPPGSVLQTKIDMMNPRWPRTVGGSRVKLFCVTGNDVGDGVYLCKEQRVDTSEWDDADFATKVLDKSGAANVEVLNLAEADFPAHSSGNLYVRHLAVGDYILATRIRGDESDNYWVGVPVMDHNFERTRMAYAVNDAPSAATITCYLDKHDASSPQITVYCSICGGTALDSCIPYIESGDVLPIVWVNDLGQWWCTSMFQDVWVCT